jgi:hypothetical protein
VRNNAEHLVLNLLESRLRGLFVPGILSSQWEKRRQKNMTNRIMGPSVGGGRKRHCARVFAGGDIAGQEIEKDEEAASTAATEMIHTQVD